MYTANITMFGKCAGRAVSLREVLDLMTEITGWQPEVHVNPAFVRANEIHTLAGDCSKLEKVIGAKKSFDLVETLTWMTNA